MSSKLDKSAIVAGGGLIAALFLKIVKKVHEKGGTDEDIHRLDTPDGENVLDKIVDFIVSTKRQIFKVVVNYAQSLEEMIKAGEYDWVNNNITSDHFSIKGTGQKEMEIILFHFNRIISSDAAIAEMAKAGYRPVQVEELLALGAKEKELQKQFPIVALGSVWRSSDGNRGVLYLDWGGVERDLNLGLFGSDWDGNYRFAAVRNAS
jgi:hypothetical protein